MGAIKLYAKTGASLEIEAIQVGSFVWINTVALFLGVKRQFNSRAENIYLPFNERRRNLKFDICAFEDAGREKVVFKRLAINLLLTALFKHFPVPSTRSFQKSKRTVKCALI